MNDEINTFPVGIQLLGRVLNASGEAIDKKGPLTGIERVPLYRAAPGVAEGDKASLNQVLETGIKVIDLLAPIPRGGIAGLFGNAGVGKLVVVEELMHNIITRHNGYVVCLGTGEGTYEAVELMDAIREAELEDKFVLLFEELTESPEVRQRMIQGGLTIAEHFRQQGHEVLLVVDRDKMAQGSLTNTRALRRMLREGGVTAILQGSEDDYWQFRQGDTLDDFDCQIVLTRKMTTRDLWPAVDRLLSSSRLLDSGAVDSEHVQVAREVLEVLRRYAELEMKEQQELSDADKELARRAVKIQYFFTQPFFVAEAYTEIPGEYVGVEETVKGFKELLEGRYEDLPDKAFYFVGGVDEAIAKAGKEEKEGKQSEKR